MLFRYKIDKYHEHICDGVNLIHYEVKIQKFNEGNLLFKWETRKVTTLKHIVELLGDEYCFSHWENALREIHETITKYGSVNNMIAEYIRKFIMRDIESENEMQNIENSIDNLVLTGDWQTIEFKEN